MFAGGLGLGILLGMMLERSAFAVQEASAATGKRVSVWALLSPADLWQDWRDWVRERMAWIRAGEGGREMDCE